MRYSDTIDGLLEQLDDCISKRDEQYGIVEAEYALPNEKDKMISSRYPEYSRRRDRVAERFSKDFLELQDRLDRLCWEARARQPRFTSLSPECLNVTGRVPRNIIFGRTCARYRELDITVPHILPFPVKEPMLLSSDSNTEMLFSLILRLLYTLPVGKVELNAFDPNYFGGSLQKYSSLFANKTVSPFGKIISSKEDLTTMLRDASRYAENLIQNVFTNSDECGCWGDYNRHMYKTGQINSIIPYKVFFLCDVPDTMGIDNIELLIRLCNVCERCGILVAMTVDDGFFSSRPENQWEQSTRMVKSFLDRCQNIEDILVSVPGKKNLKNLALSGETESMPDIASFDRLISAYCSRLAENSNRGGNFEDLYNAADFFSESAVQSVRCAVGLMPEDNSEAVLEIGDRVPHVLIGGTTGSGKSNLLHSLIVQVCKRYSPDEVSLYLLDFKQGVEFSKYAQPITLPHAALIATEADVEYGLSVLEHIVDEIKRRFSLFKKANCTQYSDYRNRNPDEVLPRIIVLIDEFQELFAAKETPAVFNSMRLVVKQGRAAGVHLIMATQTLKGLGNMGSNFSEIESQFSGRIALKCSASESSTILGSSFGASNEAAAYITIPFAIMNTNSGLQESNIKFAVPKTDDYVFEAASDISREWQRRGMTSETMIYRGDMLPVIPDHSAFLSDETEILLGETSDYDSVKYRVRLPDRKGENLLICGYDKRILPGMRQSAMLSARGCRNNDEVIFVGRDCSLFETDGVMCFDSLKDFAEYMIGLGDGVWFSRRIVVMNNCDPACEICYPTQTYTPPTTSEAIWFKSFMSDCAAHGTHIIAVFEDSAQFKASGMPGDSFRNTVAFLLPYKVLTDLGMGMSIRTTDGFMPANRALIYRDGNEIRRIKPYTVSMGEYDE